MAYYDWYHWFPNVDRDGKPQDVLIALSKEMAAKEINVSYWQLDAYWYDLEIAPGYCIVDWHAVADQFPKGLAWLKEQGRKSFAPQRFAVASNSSSSYQKWMGMRG